MRITSSLYFILFPALLLLLPSANSSAQTLYPLGDTAVIHRLDPYVDVLVDPTEGISIEQVVQTSFQHRFQPNKGNLTFGYLKSAIWLKVRTKTLSPHTAWYLEIPAPFLEYVDFYQLK